MIELSSNLIGHLFVNIKSNLQTKDLSNQTNIKVCMLYDFLTICKVTDTNVLKSLKSLKHQTLSVNPDKMSVVYDWKSRNNKKSTGYYQTECLEGELNYKKGTNGK